MEKRELKESVPQIVEKTGVSADYLNEILFWLATKPKNAATNIFNLLKTYGAVMRRYEERFPAEKFKSVVNEKNRDRIAQLNAIADDINEKAKEGCLTLPFLQALARRSYHIVYDREMEEER